MNSYLTYHQVMKLFDENNVSQAFEPQCLSIRTIPEWDMASYKEGCLYFEEDVLKFIEILKERVMQ